MDNETLSPLTLRSRNMQHPFRQSLPIDISQVAAEKRELELRETADKKGMGEDVSLFLLSFLAFFTAFYMFIF
ncbi:hypothetical protein [Parasphingorhabdus sp.]|uniref:hypothetical protein n=1 Tax=Parasphingorhabdus sp. TaxID=2709688 RepID=UPI003A91F5DF